MATVKIRGEHLINVYWYYHDESYRLKFGPAQGYDETFARRHDEIIASLAADPEQKVCAVQGLDDICLKSPCGKLNDQCSVPDLLAKDARTIAVFGLQEGVEYTARELLAQLDKMPLEEAPK